VQTAVKPGPVSPAGGVATETRAGDIADFYRRLLRRKAAEVLRALRLAAVERPDLTSADLRSIVARLDGALDGLTGTTPRDRALIWLHEKLRELSGEYRVTFQHVRGEREPIEKPERHGSKPISPLTTSRNELLGVLEEAGVKIRDRSQTWDGLIVTLGEDPHSFMAGLMLHVPWYSGPITPKLEGLVEAYCLSLLRRPPRGRRRPGASRPATRAECFRRVAVELNVVSPRVTAYDLQAMLRQAKRNVRPHPSPGVRPSRA
jgi:hypothetical protein